MRIRWWVLLVTTFLLSSLIYIWFFAGFKNHVLSLLAINSLSVENRSKAKENFIGSNNTYLYGGTLAGITNKILPGVWVWGRRGLRYFRTDQYSVYSYYSICNNQISGLESGESFVIDRNVDTDLIAWMKKVRVGQYIVLLTTRPDQGGTIGNLREAKVHDWLAFLPKSINIDKLCKK